MTQGDDDHYIIEYIRLGKNLKVIAIDPRTSTEVSIVGSTSVSKKELARLAARKLTYVLTKGSK